MAARNRRLGRCRVTGLTLRQVTSAAAWTCGIGFSVIVLLGVGRFIPTHPELALVAATAVLALGLTAIEPAFIPLLAMPAIIVVARVAGSAVNISVSDVALFVAFWPALFFAKRNYSEHMRSVLWLVAIYQMATLFTVIANPYTANVIDWFHTGLLVGGSLVVGWAVGREGHARAGMSLLLLMATILALSTIAQGLLQYASGDFSAVYVSWPYGMHKNFVGTTLGSVALIAYTRPVWMGWAKRWSITVFWLCTVGVLLTQSRQGLIALGVTLVFIVLRSDPERTRSKIILVTIPPAASLVAITVKNQLESGNNFNSTVQRVNWFRDSFDVWMNNPLFGVGLRWWYTDRFPVRFQPPNAELEVLTTAGIVGLIGFLVLMFGTLAAFKRMDPRYGTLAMSMVLSRFVQGQFDIFWVSVAASLPFLVAGVCLGAQAFEADDEMTARKAVRLERKEVGS